MLQIIALLPLLLPAWEPSAAQLGPVILHPTEYSSPSGEYVLFVDPSHRLGAGPGSYRMSRDGVELWNSKQLFTLSEVKVTDAGIAVGFGYTAGSQASWASDSFHVAAFAASGELLVNHITERESSRFMHRAANPLAAGIFLDSESDRFVVRVRDPDVIRGFEAWWTYSTSSPERVSVQEPEAHFGLNGRGARHLTDACFLKGVPLKLAWWWDIDFEKKLGDEYVESGTFSLVNEEGHSVWQLSFPADYNLPDDKDGQYEFEQQVRGWGALQGVEPEGRFRILNAQSREVQEYLVARSADASGWEVTSIGSTPFRAPEPKSHTPVNLPTLKLKPLPPVSLGTSPPVLGGLGPIDKFAFGPAGQFRILRWWGEEKGSFVHTKVTSSGEVLEEVSFKLPEQAGSIPWRSWE